MRKIIPLLTTIIIASVCASTWDEEQLLDNPKKKIISGIHEGSTMFHFEPSFITISGDSFFPYIPPIDSKSAPDVSLPSSSSYNSSSNSSSSSMYTSQDYFNCSSYGPFSLTNPQNFQATFTYELYSIASQRIIERVRLFRNGSVVCATTKASIDYTQGQRNNVEFTINLIDYWSEAGLQLRFEILNSSTYEILKTYSAYFYPPKDTTVPISTLKSKLYTSDSLGFYGTGTKMTELFEIMDFRNIGDYIDNDYYYRLDISRNTFIYRNENTLTYKNASLRFNDSERLFPHMSHQANGDVVIPLELYRKNDGTVNFRYKNHFYVNKRSLDTSDAYIYNYAYSNDFYLPINGLKRFNGKTLYIDINGLGMDSISTTVPLKYQLNRAIVGTCSDGQYCVIGGNR